MVAGVVVDTVAAVERAAAEPEVVELAAERAVVAAKAVPVAAREEPEERVVPAEPEAPEVKAVPGAEAPLGEVL